MTQDKYQFEVVNQEYIPNKENPQRVKITVETEIDGEKVQETKRFTPKQVSEGRWEKHFCRWVDEQTETNNIPDLQGETIENSGYDHTGPERDYPDR